MVDISKYFWERKTKRLGARDKVIANPDGSVSYLLWGNEIAKLRGNELMVSDTGWKTATTKDRLNSILSELGLRVRTYRGEWFIEGGAGRKYRWKDSNVIDIEDPTKKLASLVEEKLEKRVKGRTEKVNEAVKIWMDRVDRRDLSVGGECWGLTMGITECEKCELLGTEECGGGITFLYKVLADKGYRYPQVFLGVDEKGNINYDTVNQHRDIIRRALRSYFNRVFMGIPIEKPFPKRLEEMGVIQRVSVAEPEERNEKYWEKYWNRLSMKQRRSFMAFMGYLPAWGKLTFKQIKNKVGIQFINDLDEAYGMH